METNRKLFLLIYMISLMYGSTIHKNLGILADTTLEEKLLPGEYFLPVDVDENLEAIFFLKRIRQGTVRTIIYFYLH